VTDDLGPDRDTDSLAGLITALDATAVVVCTHGERSRDSSTNIPAGASLVSMNGPPGVPRSKMSTA